VLQEIGDPKKAAHSNGCLAQWEADRRIDAFPLGQQDSPDRLLIPEKLYGRDREIEKLLASFDRVIESDYFELFNSFRSAINPRHELFVVARSGHGFRA